jgi:pyrimidine deaminase RibD-like protein
MLSDTNAVLDTIDAICRGDIQNMVQGPEFEYHPATVWSDTDIAFMREAIALGRAQMGRTWPNPPVGCVIVKDGQIIAQGATGDGGRPHAEEIALDAAGDAAEGATAYVTLEPCGKRSSGGCSCSERLVKARVARVVYACPDPSPYASHIGPERIEAAGIPLDAGVCAAEAEPLIAGFVHFLATGRPLVAESETPQGFDAEFIRDPALSPEDDLRAWGDRGYRALFVLPGSEIALELKRANLVSLKDD